MFVLSELFGASLQPQSYQNISIRFFQANMVNATNRNGC